MEFRLELEPKAFPVKLGHRDNIMLMGSCFTEQMGSKLSAYRFSTIENPHGILFNPVSICKALIAYMESKEYATEDLFYFNERWSSWDHHSRFSNMSQTEALDVINHAREAATAFLQQADWLILTLGSAFVYELENGRQVANCHKVPTDQFRKKLLSIEETLSALDNLIHRLFIFNPGLKIIFTISPVRHLRDGFVENNRSKSVLIQSTHRLVEKFEKLYYFPAYELVIDDLRDYRFYAEDMVHPNYLATDYVWEKFRQACIEPQAGSLFAELDRINLARRHKPFHPETEQHQRFLRKTIEKIQDLKKLYPYLDLGEEERWFINQLPV